MKKTGVTILLGTDNAMINTPDMIEEIRLLYKTGLFSLEELLTNISSVPPMPTSQAFGRMIRF
jgi:cytosine/adenosine deaminase-related metal-dependent hydrolase